MKITGAIQIEYIEIIKIHAFCLSTTIIVQKTHEFFTKKESTPLIYLLNIHIGRLILATIFVWPIIYSENTLKKQIIINFSIIYFAYLLIEMLLKNQKSKISK